MIDMKETVDTENIRASSNAFYYGTKTSNTKGTQKVHNTAHYFKLERIDLVMNANENLFCAVRITPRMRVKHRDTQTETCGMMNEITNDTIERHMRTTFMGDQGERRLERERMRAGRSGCA
jgi:hypothetical protein